MTPRTRRASAAGRRVRARSGSKDSGADLYELRPGEEVCPYDYEYGEEEWALVLEGTPSMRRRRAPSSSSPSISSLPEGTGGRRPIRNYADAPARIFMWSMVVVPTASVDPDSDKSCWTGNKEIT